MSNPHQLGDGPIQDAYRQKMTDLARSLDKGFNGNKRGADREVGFVLLVFGFGDPSPEKRCNFISNGADRRDIVALFKEMIEKFEAQDREPVTGGGGGGSGNV
jgi:hypothetical protein